MGASERRLDGERLLIMRGRLLQPTQRLEGQPQVVVRLGVIRCERQRLRVMGDRGIGTLERELRVGQHVANRGASVLNLLVRADWRGHGGPLTPVAKAHRPN